VLSVAAVSLAAAVSSVFSVVSSAMLFTSDPFNVSEIRAGRLARPDDQVHRRMMLIAKPDKRVRVSIVDVVAFADLLTRNHGAFPRDRMPVARNLTNSLR
jgi:hypothetical protein